MKKTTEKNKGKVRRGAKQKEGISLSPRNYLIGLVGIIVIVIGYIFLAQPPVNSSWSLTVAPILLVIAYCIILPIAIMYRAKSKKSADSE